MKLHVQWQPQVNECCVRNVPHVEKTGNFMLILMSRRLIELNPKDFVQASAGNKKKPYKKDTFQGKISIFHCVAVEI